MVLFRIDFVYILTFNGIYRLSGVQMISGMVVSCFQISVLERAQPVVAHLRRHGLYQGVLNSSVRYHTGDQVLPLPSGQH